MVTYFFIKYFSEGFDQYFEKISKSNSIFTFDLEDSIKSVESELRTDALKTNSRLTLYALLTSNNYLSKFPLAIRVNHPCSGEFVKDLEVLQKASHITWDTIIFPKVENLETIEFGIECLKGNLVSFNKISILIESKKGVLGISDILSRKPPQLKVIMFGHADYNLDLGIFPFLHQNHEVYWEWISNIIENIKTKDITFVNSPCLYLKHDDLFIYNLDRLCQLKIGKVGQITLNLSQTLLCHSYRSNIDASTRYLPHETGDDPTTFAQKIVESFKHQMNGKSFLVNHNNYLISPHEYHAASCYLKRCEKL
jgi:citrate lyase beta subunit